jgi:chemotaxis protein MotD
MPPISLAAGPSNSVAAAAPQSLLPAEPTAADSKTTAMVFLDQLSKLLQAAMPGTQSTAPEVSGTQPGSTPAGQAQPEITPDIATAQSPIILVRPPDVTLPAKQPETQAIQSRGLGANKSKAEAATPGRRATATSDQSAMAILSALLPPEAIAIPPIASPATRDPTTPHEPSRDQHNRPSTASDADQPITSVLKVDATSAGLSELNPQPQQDASPTQVAPATPTDALATIMSPAVPQSTPPSLRTTETTATATTASTPPSHHGSPAAQVAPALMQIGHAPDGAQRLTVRLDPPELGHVQVKIDRPSDAAARVEITVEKQETLTLLLRDQPQLQRALDQAGVPTDGRTVTFHIAAPAPSPRTDPGTTPVAGTDAGGLTGDGSHGAARQHGRPANQRHDTIDDDGADFTPTAARGWLRTGLDITA